MLFQEEHIDQIRDGEKTETRRLWDSPQVTEGGIYIAATELFTPHTEANCYVRVTEVQTEPLGELDAAAADAEGGYTVPEFRDVWRDINGEWDPDVEVYVVAFEYVGRSRPEDDRDE